MGTALLAVALVLVTLLAIPVTVTFRFAWPQTGDNDATVRWAFGLLRVRLPTPKKAGHPDADAVTQDSASRNTSRASSKNNAKSLNVWAAFRHRPLRRRLLRFARAAWQALHTRDLHVHVRLGLDDPADTGRLWAIVGPISGALAAVRSVSLRIEPDFTDAAAAVDSAGCVRVVPLQFVLLAIGLLASPALWQGLRRARSRA